MKRLALVPVLLLILAPLTFLAQSRDYQVDANHSNIGFSVPMLGGLSQVGGKFARFEMFTTYNAEDITKSSVKVTIDAASIDTGINKRDDHLRTSDFFDVKKYPHITFESTKVEVDGDHLKVTGMFSMHGVEKEITLTAKVKEVETGKMGTILSVSLSTTINRLEFGVGGTLPKPGEKPKPSHLGAEIAIQIDCMSVPMKKPEAEKKPADKKETESKE